MCFTRFSTMFHVKIGKKWENYGIGTFSHNKLTFSDIPHPLPTGSTHVPASHRYFIFLNFLIFFYDFGFIFIFFIFLRGF